MSGAKRVGKYPDEMRERAVRMLFEHQAEYQSQWRAIESISKSLGINHETLRIWVRKAQVDTGQRPGLTQTSGFGCVSSSVRTKSCAGRMRS